MKIWDVRVERAPVVSIEIAQKMKPGLPNLRESEKILDKFSVCFSADDRRIITGGYNSGISIWNVNGAHVNTVYLNDILPHNECKREQINQMVSIKFPLNIIATT